MTPLLSIRESAARLNMHYDTVLDHVRAGRLQAIRFGKRDYRVSEEALESFIQASIVGPEVGPIEHRNTPELALIDRGQKRAPVNKHAWRTAFRAR